MGKSEKVKAHWELMRAIRARFGDPVAYEYKENLLDESAELRITFAFGVTVAIGVPYVDKTREDGEFDREGTTAWLRAFHSCLDVVTESKSG